MLDAVTVIVPYYQRSAGLLARAVRSILSQEVAIRRRIVVVDDGSPLPAHAELAGLARDERAAVEIVRQKNAGPAGARNAGLHRVADDCRYVAFLDSDDRWTPGHLGRALEALEQDASVFFSNCAYADGPTDVFARVGFRADAGAPAAASRLPARDLFELVLSANNPVRLPTLVYCYPQHRTVRFIDQLWMGEDLAFMLDLAVSSARCAFSEEIGCVFETGGGRAVNIYDSAGWGSPRAVWRAGEELRFRKLVARRHVLDQELRRLNQQAIAALRDAIVRSVLHRLRRGQAIDLRSLTAAVRVDPALSFMGPWNALAVAAQKRRRARGVLARDRLDGDRS
jgi:succinoglycan biosynthesis protein ExoW